MGNCFSCSSSDSSPTLPKHSSTSSPNSASPQPNQPNEEKIGEYHPEVETLPLNPQPTPATTNTTMSQRRQFISINSRGELFLPSSNSSAGNTPFRFASLNAPELIASSSSEAPEPFEQLDTLRSLLGFGRPVTRCYTLTVKSRNKDRAHIMGWDWDKGEWKLGEDYWKRTDKALAGAEKYDCRIIFPIINQDFGSEETNWVGNTRDLIKMRKGVDKWEGVDFWRDREMIESFKILITQLMNRVNTVSKIRYGDDPSILAWETGNELNAYQRPAPASWTLEVARHIKQLSPKTLIMDGSFARNDDPERCYEKEVLESKYVDLVSYHYYGSGDIRRVKRDVEIAKRHGKGFIAGEFGFFSKVDDYAKFLKEIDSAGGQGSLVWSLRPHSHKGGFRTHGEGNDIWSYHVPGFQSNSSKFDSREKPIVAAIRKASFKINHEPVPPHPTPNAPEAFLSQDGTKVCWRGSTWAAYYELWVNDKHGDQKAWKVFENQLWDAFEAGQGGYDLNKVWKEKGRDVFIMLRAIGEDGHVGTYSNVLQLGSSQGLDIQDEAALI